MQSFPDGFRALIVGATGAIGGAIQTQLDNSARCAGVVALGRGSTPAIDFDDESSFASAAALLKGQGPFHLILNAAGVLHTPEFMPEKRLGDIGYAQLLSTFRVNAFGPAMFLAHFSPLLDAKRGVLAVLSAKVGSITDNRLGGWYSYRASKAALNMLLKTAAIEVRRSNPNAVLVALHPGTVQSALSEPFGGARVGRPAAAAAADLLRVIDGLTPDDTGRFYSYQGEQLPW